MKPRKPEIKIEIKDAVKVEKVKFAGKTELVKQLQKELTGKVIPEKPGRVVPDRLIYAGPDNPDETDRIEIGKGGGKGHAIPGTIKIRDRKDRGNIP